MLHTYDLYLQDPAGRERCEVVTCAAEEVLERAREVLEAQEAQEVEVRRGGERLFSLAK